jgi:D-3-phosphoglycerate dehydrogenase/(S)-sulfolactate dehydrogenase
VSVLRQAPSLGRSCAPASGTTRIDVAAADPARHQREQPARDQRQAVAEYTIGLLLGVGAAAGADGSPGRGRWLAPARRFELRGKTLGLIGRGAVATAGRAAGGGFG